MHPALSALLLGAALLATPAPAPAPAFAPPPAFDLILAGGRVVDGTGAPWFRADLGIRGDRIEAIGDLSAARAARRIEVAGKMVAPGFIDLLGQSELFVLVDNRVESKIRQGITTEITGEGGSVAPVSAETLRDQRPFLEEYKLTVDWTDLAGYFRRFERTGSAINLGTCVGAATVRQIVLGSGEVQPAPAQLAAMEALVETAMQQGALCLSTALIYPPGSYARTPELIALAKVAARHGGVYASHIRGEGDEVLAALDEAFTIGREAKIPVEIWHLKVSGKKNWGRMKEVLARVEAAREGGLDAGANMYPYDASSNGLDSNLPEWAQAGGVDAIIARLHDPAQREKIKAGLWSGGLGEEKAQQILLVSCLNPGLKRYMGKRLSEVAKEQGKSAEDALLDLVEADRANVGVVRFGLSEDDVRLGLQQPWVSLGSDNPGQAIDGPFAQVMAHPRGFGAAPRLLGHYARDLKLFSIEEAVRRLTSLPARRFHLWSRGLLRPGMTADVTVFDPRTVRDLATYEKPLVYAEGIETVIVSGKVVLDQGKLTAERPGRALRRQ